MEALSLDDVVAAVRGIARGRLPAAVTGVSTDTRTIAAGDLFVALQGDRFDGHAFLAAARERGAVAAITREGAPVPDGMPHVAVADTGRALLDLGALHRSRLRAKVVAITGSNGKTTTKDMVARVASSRLRTVWSPHSFNNFVGVPLTLFLAGKDTEAVVLEVGTNHPGEIDTLARVARPDVAVVTNVAAAHLDGLGTVEGVLLEKGALLDHVAEGGVAVLNADDDASIGPLKKRARCRVVTTGVRRRADCMATMPLCDTERVAFHLNGTTKVRVPMLGCHNLYNALTALAVGRELGIPDDAGAASLREFEGPPMRLKKQRCGDRIVIDDTYNANPGSMLAAIKTFASLDVPGRRVLVLGDMAEMGSESEAHHRRVGQQLSCGTFHLVVGVGKDARAILEGAAERGLPRETLLHYPDVTRCARDLPGRLLRDDAVLVKGSRRMQMERVVGAIAAASEAGAACANGASP